MLNEEQINKVKQTIMSSGWNDVMYPAMVNRGKQALNALTLSPSERKESGGEFKDMDDHTLRAIIRDAEWMTACWRNEISIFDFNQKKEAEQKQLNGV